MKKYKVTWGVAGSQWSSSEAEIPAMNPAQAIEVTCSKHRISADQIHSVTLLGNW